MDQTLTFVRWLDNYEQENPNKKFASVEQAYIHYKDLENKNSLIDQFTREIKDGEANSVFKVNAFDLSVEVIEKAITDPQGEFFYAALVPGPDGIVFSDIGLKNAGNLVDLFSQYALNQNRRNEVDKFIRIVNGILVTAQIKIIGETNRRSKLN